MQPGKTCAETEAAYWPLSFRDLLQDDVAPPSRPPTPCATFLCIFSTTQTKCCFINLNVSVPLFFLPSFSRRGFLLWITFPSRSVSSFLALLLLLLRLQVFFFFFLFCQDAAVLSQHCGSFSAKKNLYLSDCTECFTFWGTWTTLQLNRCRTRHVKQVFFMAFLTAEVQLRWLCSSNVNINISILQRCELRLTTCLLS